MTTINEMDKLEKYSKPWFTAAFEDVNVPDYIKVVAAKISSIYNIGGQADPGYIANLINRYVVEKPTVCTKSSTGEHSDVQLSDNITCIWCWQLKN